VARDERMSAGEHGAGQDASPVGAQPTILATGDLTSTIPPRRKFPKLLGVAFATLIAVLVIVLVVVTLLPSSAVTAFLGTSGTTTFQIHDPDFWGSMGGKTLTGKAVSAGLYQETNWTFTGTLDGTAFSLKATFNNPVRVSLPVLYYDASGTFGSEPVHAIFKITLPGLRHLSVTGTIGGRTLKATGQLSGPQDDLLATFHYTVS
jgi:hypothetical protein